MTIVRPLSEVSVAYGEAHREVRDKQGQTQILALYAVPAIGSTARLDRERKGRTPSTISRIRRRVSHHRP